MGPPKEPHLIQVDLSPAEVVIEPGGTAQLIVTITNRQPHDDHVFIEVEGVDVEWYALPVPSLTLAAGASATARIPFKVERSSASRADAYPFVVRVRSMETGVAGVQQGTLAVKPFSSLQVELSPKRAISTFLHPANVVDVRVTNLGNHEEAVDLSASDPDNDCNYEFDRERLDLRPGHSEMVGLTVVPAQRPVIGGTRLYGYTVTARSARDSYVSANSQGQLERHAMLSIVALALLLLLIVGAGTAVALWPKPVTVNAFSANPTRITQGDKVRLSWDVTNATKGVVIMPDELRSNAPTGTVEVQPAASTTYTLVARGSGEAKRLVTVEVLPAPVPKKPLIHSFTASQARIHEGDAVTLQWKAENVTHVLLNPLGNREEYPLYKSQEVKPTQTTEYELAAQGPGGVVSKRVRVTVVPATQSLAEVEYFRARPDTITAGEKTKLSWSVNYAAAVEIDNGVGGGLKTTSSAEVSPINTTVYTLRVTDKRGNVTTKLTKVTVNPPEPPPTDPPAEPGTGTDTTQPPVTPP
jgi:hypothetical protein